MRQHRDIDAIRSSGFGPQLNLAADFTAFVQKAFGTVSPGDGFLPNWHIEAMCHELSKMMRGETRRLIISIPPRHLKSICTSVAFQPGCWAMIRPAASSASAMHKISLSSTPTTHGQS